jgi:hypothetical protein
MSADAGALAHAAAADDVDRVSSLPVALILNIFSRLTADERARCATVRRGWRAAVSDHNLWTRLNLSVTSGVTCTVNSAALVAAAARAGGHLEALDLSGRDVVALLAFVTTNSATLRELRISDASVEYIESLLRAAPRLRVLEAHACVEAADAGRMLRNEAPFGPLRLTQLSLDNDFDDVSDAVAVDTLLTMATDLVEHPVPLLSLRLGEPPFHDTAVLEAVVDALLACRVRRVEFTGDRMGLSPASVPALVRLLGGDALEELQLFCGAAADELLLDDDPAAALLAAAFRDNTTLTSLTLATTLNHNAAAVVLILQALKAHPSLRKLHLRDTIIADVDNATYEALGELVAVNAPELQELSVHACVTEAGLYPLVNALRGNTHLRVLDCSDNDMRGAFARDVLLPAVHVNTGLRHLAAVNEDELGRAFPVSEAEMASARTFQEQAEALVAARGP